jgi:hypothetical protein
MAVWQGPCLAASSAHKMLRERLRLGGWAAGQLGSWAAGQLGSWAAGQLGSFGQLWAGWEPPAIGRVPHCLRQLSRRLAPLAAASQEVTRRVNMCDIWQAAYTAGVVIPKPVATSRYWHRCAAPLPPPPPHTPCRHNWRLAPQPPAPAAPASSPAHLGGCCAGRSTPRSSSRSTSAGWRWAARQRGGRPAPGGASLAAGEQGASQTSSLLASRGSAWQPCLLSACPAAPDPAAHIAP